MRRILRAYSASRPFQSPAHEAAMLSPIILCNTRGSQLPISMWCGDCFRKRGALNRLIYAIWRALTLAIYQLSPVLSILDQFGKTRAAVKRIAARCLGYRHSFRCRPIFTSKSVGVSDGSLEGSSNSFCVQICVCFLLELNWVLWSARQYTSPEERGGFLQPSEARESTNSERFVLTAPAPFSCFVLSLAYPFADALIRGSQMVAVP